MKKLLLFVLVLQVLFVSAQKLNPQQVQNLYWLAKSWGYLKYHHPDVTQGKYNWDSVLIADIRLAKMSKDHSQVIEKLMQQAGTYKEVKVSLLPDSLFSNTDFSWIDRLPSAAQRQYFKDLKHQVRSNDQRYVTNKSPYGETGWALFNADTAYSSSKIIDGNIGLLTLFRYWNAVDYFAPYRHLIHNNWDSTLVHLIPQFNAVKNHFELLRLCEKLGALTNDGHSYLSARPIYEFYGLKSPAFTLKFVEGNYVVHQSRNDTLFAATGLQPGDIIVKKEGRHIDAIVADRMPYTVQSNTDFAYYRIGVDLLNANKDSIAITVNRNGATFTKHIKLYENMPAQRGRPIWRNINDSTAFVQLHRLRKDTLPSFFRDIASSKVLIIDARGYPRFDIWYEFLSYVQNKNTPFCYYQNAVINRPGYFYYNQNPADFYWVAPKQDQYKGQIYLLVDESCGSLGEGFPLSIQYLANAKTIGSRTGGFNGNITGVTVGGGGYLLFSGLGVLAANGHQTQQNGIHIHYEVRPTIQGIREGRDEVLEMALELEKIK